MAPAISLVPAVCEFKDSLVCQVPGQSRLSVSKNKTQNIKQQRQSECYNKSGEEILFSSAGKDKLQVVFRWIKNCAKPVRKWPKPESGEVRTLRGLSPSRRESRGSGGDGKSITQGRTRSTECLYWRGRMNYTGRWGRGSFWNELEVFHLVSSADGEGINKVRGTVSGADRREERTIPHLEIQVPGTSFAKTTP